MEFREMRRIKQQLDDSACIEILEKNTSGVLAVLGDGGYPYAVPMSYVYADGKIYFHSAKTGHKIDAILGCDKVSFCVVDRDQVIPEEYTTYFRSVVAFGRAKILEDGDDFRTAAEKLARKYHPGDSEKNRDSMVDGGLGRMYMVEIEIEHMTGKAAIELVRGDTQL